MAQDLKSTEIDFKERTEQILKSYLHASSDANLDILSFLDENMSVIGTGKQEFFRNFNEFSQSYIFDGKQRENIQFTWKDLSIEEMKLDETHVLTYGSVSILGTFESNKQTIDMDTRFTIVYALIDGIWKVIHIHHSVPDKNQKEDEEFSYSLENRLEESQNMIAALASDYLNVYIIEPETDRGTIIKLDGYVIQGIKETPKDFTYSKVLETYAKDRVCDEDRANFLAVTNANTLVQSFVEGRERLEFNYRVPLDGKLEHYSGLYIRISKENEPLKIIAGFRNSEDVISIQRKTRDEGLYSAYKAVSDLYLAMFRVDVKNNSYSTIKTTDAILKYTLSNNYKFDETLKPIISGLADQDSMSSAFEFLNLATIEERMQDHDHIVTRFTGKIAGPCKMHLIKEDTDAYGNLWHVILAVEVLEDGEYQPAFDVLSRSFQNVLLINLENYTAKILKLDGFITSELDEEKHRIFDYPTLLKKYIADRVDPDDREMLYEKLCVEHLFEVFSQQDEYIGNYLELVDGQVHHYQYNLSKPKGNKNIVCGFQNIDAIIEEHLEQERIEKEKERAHQKEVNQQIAIINTLAKSFSNVYVANLKDGSARVIRLADNYHVNAIRDVKELTFPFNQVVNRWIEENVHPKDKERIAKTLTIENFRKIFANQDEYTGTYRSYDHGALHNYQYDFRRIKGSDEIVAGFKMIDSIIEEQQAQQKRERQLEEARLQEVKEYAEVITSLSTIYSTIFRAELDTHAYEVLNSVDLMGSLAGRKGNFDEVKEDIINAFMAEDMREAMHEFLDFNTLADRLKDVNTVVAEYKNPLGRWFQARFIVKRRDENGGAKEVLYVARDFTDEKEKEIEQQNQLSNALVVAQQANKAKSTFLNSMSHDIRTPMNAIIGFTALAQTHMDNPNQVKDYLSKISTSSTHLLSLINDILDMSRIESGTVKLDEKPVHIPDVLHDLRIMIQGLVNAKNLNLYIDTQDVIHEDVICDQLRLNQILINIVGNAIKFTQAGGDIMIRLLEKPCRIKHYTTLEFSVKDNGIGMSKDFIGHIFDTFSREYSSTVSGIQGTGLGMAITKNIVDMMGGEILVESEEGKGSLFTVILNLQLANEPVKQEAIPELLGARVLVVDDDLNTCRSVSKMLRDIQMRPDWTASGKEAVVRAQEAVEINDEYKVYIIDYLMPDMNGIETVRRIRRVIRQDVPIIVLSAYDWTDYEHEAREAGVTAFVSKPIFMSELRKVLSQSDSSQTVTEQKRQYDYRGIRALLVEDNELNREIATVILEETGMEIDSVNDGDLAVSTINEAADDQYDLIFMDIQMPRMDGYTATREIRTLADNRKANIPIVAMTANAFEEDKQKAYASGMNGHIIKPINIDEIAKVIDLILEEKK